MTDEQNVEPETEIEETENEAAEGDKIILTQAKFDDIIERRLARLRTQYEGIETQATELSTQNEALTSDFEQTKTDLEATRLDLTRYRVAMRHGITDEEDISLFLTGADEETLERQAERIKVKATTTTPVGVPLHHEGGTPVKSDDAVARQFFGV